jgi:hypothetical protein
MRPLRAAHGSLRRCIVLRCHLRTLRAHLATCGLYWRACARAQLRRYVRALRAVCHLPRCHKRSRSSIYCTQCVHLLRLQP